MAPPYKGKDRLPFRYKGKNGKFVGNFRVRLRDRSEVNLRTRDANEANRRAKLAHRGQTTFEDDTGEAAAQALTGPAGTGDASTPPVVEPPPPAAPIPSPPPPNPAVAGASSAHTAAAALPSMPSAASSPPNGTPPPSPDGVRPDAYFPPSAGWAETLRGAAADAQGAAAAAAAAEDAEDDEAFTVEELENMIEGAAGHLVMLQLVAQAWIGAHAKPLLGSNIEVAPVHETNEGIVAGKKRWKRFLKKLATRYLPKAKVPDWAAAMGAVAIGTLPVQFGPDCKVMPDKPETDAEAAPADKAA